MTVEYSLTIDEPGVEPFAFHRSLTIGRHLDNDLVLAGEDVRDFHVRVELSDRGPRVVALPLATTHVGDRVVADAHGLMPGDEVVIGHHRIRIDLHDDHPPGGWTLYEIDAGEGIPLDEEVLVGRGEACRLKLREGHVSRRHAIINRVGNTVWVKDLGSSNGTFVNGDRVIGARRLFHGDELAFDFFRYQLIGNDPELTPIRPPGAPPVDALPELRVSATPEGTDKTPPNEEPGIQLATGIRDADGPALVREENGRVVRVHRLRLGRQVIGSGPGTDVRLASAGIALRHAELELRADGAILINLAPQNDTALNGQTVRTAKLADGDELRVGELVLKYREASPVAAKSRGRPWVIVASAIATVALFAAIVWYLLPLV